MSHCLIPPSSAHVWGPCPASALAALMYPGEDTDDSKAGESAHGLGTRMIREGAAGNTPSDSQLAAMAWAEDITVGSEAFQAAEMYASHCVHLMRQCAIFSDLGHLMGIEKKVECHSVHKESGGTPDFWIYGRSARHLHVVDFKFGHREVDAFENKQCLNYTSGIVDLLNSEGHEPLTISITVIQPRTYTREGPIRTWSFAAERLPGYVKALSEQAHVALGQDAYTYPGEHCRDCTARHACESAGQYAMHAVDFISESLPKEMSPAAAGLQLVALKKAAKAIEFRLTGVQAQVEALVRKGTPIAGWAIEPTTGSMSWLKIGAIDKRCVKPTQLYTPLQSIAKGVPEELVKQHTERKTGSKLTYDDGTLMRKVFDK